MTGSEKLDLVLNKISDMELHLENAADRNIELPAENHIHLIDKLNQAIPAV